MSQASIRSPHINAIRDLELDNAALRLKLARHEFRQMERELKSEHPFRLDVHTDRDPLQNAVSVPDVHDASLPQLPVPMGSIHAQDTGQVLPVIGVYDDGLTGSKLAAALMGLMKTQYHSPFARLLFICSSFDAIPFLGRYGFIFEYIGDTDPARALPRLAHRYGATQIRSVGNGSVIAEHRGH